MAINGFCCFTSVSLCGCVKMSLLVGSWCFPYFTATIVGKSQGMRLHYLTLVWLVTEVAMLSTFQADMKPTGNRFQTYCRWNGIEDGCPVVICSRLSEFGACKKAGSCETILTDVGCFWFFLKWAYGHILYVVQFRMNPAVVWCLVLGFFQIRHRIKLVIGFFIGVLVF